MDRDIGKGPFVIATHKDKLVEEGTAEVVDVTGATFCVVDREDCHGKDLAAAKARATRIGESLNKTEGHLAALERVIRAGRLAIAANTTAGEPLGGLDELRKALEPFAEVGR